LKKNSIENFADFQSNITNQLYINLPVASDHKKESKSVIKIKNNKKKKKNKDNNNTVYGCPFGYCWCEFLGKEHVNLLSFYKPEDDDRNDGNIITKELTSPKVYKPYDFLFEKDEMIYSLVDRKYSDEGKRNIKNKKIIVNNTNTNTNNNNSSRISTNYDDLKFDIGPISIGRKMF
jgi:hypothetical protein